MDCPIQHILSRIDLPSVHGRQVSAALGKVHKGTSDRQPYAARISSRCTTRPTRRCRFAQRSGTAVIWRLLPFARHRVLPGHYLKQVPRDGFKCYLSDRTVQLCIDFGREKRFLSGRVRSISGENTGGANKTQADGFSCSPSACSFVRQIFHDIFQGAIQDFAQRFQRICGYRFAGFHSTDGGAADATFGL